MEQRDDPKVDHTTDPYAELREQQGSEPLRQGQLDSTYIDVSRQGPPLSEDEFLDESGD
jgi:hypothetical protein